MTTEECDAPEQDTPFLLGSYRLRGLLVLLPCVVVLGLSVWLRPDARGIGTHEQLGLQACGALVDYGWPCPACGMTTAFAASAHGRFLDAFRAHAFGPILFAATAMLAIFSAWELATNKDQLRRLRPGWWWIYTPVLGMLIGWGIKAYMGYLSGVYPLH